MITLIFIWKGYKKKELLFVELCNSPYLMHVRPTSWLVGRGKERKGGETRCHIKASWNGAEGRIISVGSIAHTAAVRDCARAENTVTRRV